MILDENCIHHNECVEQLGFTLVGVMLCQLAGRNFHGFEPDCENCNMFFEKEKNEKEFWG